MSSSSHIAPKSLYYTIFAALMIGTALTVWVAYIDLGPFNSIVAMAIAVTKASLVILYFMHVKYSPKLTKLVVVASVFWLAILLIMTMGDYLTRSWGTYGSIAGPAGVQMAQQISTGAPVVRL